MNGQDFFVKIASRPPLSRLHPAMGSFFKSYLAAEKAVRFGGQWVINTHFPPYPSPAFDRMVELFAAQDAASRRLYSVTMAVTNRCPLACGHCYNAGRSQSDMPLAALRRLAGQLQPRGATLVTLTGGEPLLRDDLEEICRAFDGRSTLIVGTTGWGLTSRRAKALKIAGVFAVGVSLDSDRSAEHDANRNRAGAFAAALKALRIAADAGLYPYVVTVAWRHLLEGKRFWPLLDFVKRIGAKEIHLLEPSASGRLAGQRDVLLTAGERRKILDYQRETAGRADLPVLSTFGYLESPEAFGCGAGLTHIYVDGSGELCPCNLVPLSFGNVVREDLDAILARMSCHFCRPRTGCVGRLLSPHVSAGKLPMGPRESDRLCRAHLPARHALPKFFHIRGKAMSKAGAAELADAYDRIHGSYDEYWSVKAAVPVERLVRELRLTGSESVFEAGCGSGRGTELLARKIARRGGHILAADISEGMLRQARRRVGKLADGRVDFHRGDALAALAGHRDLDLVFTTWVLGYIKLAPFFAAAAKALVPAGRLALVVHKQDSPRVPLEIFSELVAQQPGILRKQVSFDFPADAADLRQCLKAAGLKPSRTWEGKVTFRYDTAQQVLEHLLKSGAGTVFYDAIAPAHRGRLKKRFVEMLAARHRSGARYAVVHDYVACIAAKRL
jgi:MoaA/NifB/PqqE/SkfB family radical SAM enzyme/SAM-dependent methyltransferase